MGSRPGGRRPRATGRARRGARGADAGCWGEGHPRSGGAGGVTAAARAGVVYLVGAGPGDPGLMTVRGAELLASADVILHDRLIPAEALRGARESVEITYVGKRPGEPELPQAEI